MTPILTVRDLRVAPGGKPVLDSISFEIERGDTLGVIGPKGSGKTLLLKTLFGVLPYSGEILWAPDLIIGYIPQISDRLGPEITFVQVARQALRDTAAITKGRGLLAQFPDALTAFALLGVPDVLLVDGPVPRVAVLSSDPLDELLERVRQTSHSTLVVTSTDSGLWLPNKLLRLKRPELYSRTKPTPELRETHRAGQFELHATQTMPRYVPDK